MRDDECRPGNGCLVNAPHRSGQGLDPQVAGKVAKGDGQVLAPGGGEYGGGTRRADQGCLGPGGAGETWGHGPGIRPAGHADGGGDELASPGHRQARCNDGAVNRGDVIRVGVHETGGRRTDRDVGQV